MKKQDPSLSNKYVFNFAFMVTVVLCIFQFGVVEVHGDYCGSIDILDPRISGGSESQRGEWPFIAALYYVEQLTFFCGGTLITHQHVLTAAHCVQNKDSPRKITSDDVLVVLGAHNLSIREKGVIQSDVSAIYVHPDWKVYSDKYDADIAIFMLSRTVQFSIFIRPVCMPTQSSVVNGAKGSIVGWGISDTGKTNLEFPRRAFTNALNASYCLTMDPYIAFLSSTRTFCGTGGDGSPNKGDSGGGFFVLSGSVWVQYGIISALRINATGLVDENSVAIYTNLKLFVSWINEVTEMSGGATVSQILTESTHTTKHTTEIARVETVNKTVSLECFGDNSYFGYVASYSCQVPDMDIKSQNTKVASITAYHISGKSDQDVQRIVLFNGTMVYLPNGIGKIFKNLKVFVVLSDLKFKFLQRSNFKNLEKLIHLHIYQNEIEAFDETVLFDLPHLEQFSLYRNKLQVIGEKTFEKHPKLKVVDLRWNKLEILPKQLFANNLLLEEAYFTGNSLNVILVDFSRLRNIRRLNFNDNICVDAESEGNFGDLFKRIAENCV